MLKKLISSICTLPSEEEYKDILRWVEEKNRDLKVKITKHRVSDSDKWFYDEAAGEIRNTNSSFFQIRGLRQYREGAASAEADRMTPARQLAEIRRKASALLSKASEHWQKKLVMNLV